MGRRRKSSLTFRGYKNTKRNVKMEPWFISSDRIEFNQYEFGNGNFQDNSFYAQEKRATLVEDGALSYEEEGFMKGYQEAEEDV